MIYETLKNALPTHLQTKVPELPFLRIGKMREGLKWQPPAQRHTFHDCRCFKCIANHWKPNPHTLSLIVADVDSLEISYNKTYQADLWKGSVLLTAYGQESKIIQPL